MKVNTDLYELPKPPHNDSIMQMRLTAHENTVLVDAQTHMTLSARKRDETTTSTHLI